LYILYEIGRVTESMRPIMDMTRRISMSVNPVLFILYMAT
jgi:hypothetical protein